jgi:short-subunit dehydrogenase
MQLNGATLLLTGASGGLGRACAVRLAGEGASLLLVGRRSPVLETLLAQLPGTGHRAIAADLATGDGRRAVLAQVPEQLDGIINCAGSNHFGLLETLGDEQMRHMMEVNVAAPISLIRELLPRLRSHESAIVNVGSTLGSIGCAGYTGYCATKHALRGFTEALARELADTPVAVTYLAPRGIRTAMNDERVEAMNRELGNAMDSPEQVADALLKVLRQGTRRRYIGWPERLFVKLNSLLPGLVDSALVKQLPVVEHYCQSAGEPREAGRCDADTVG